MIAITVFVTCVFLPLFAIYCNASPTIERDKVTHAGTCYAIELTLAQTKLFNKWKPWQRILFTTAVIGGSKEWYDHNHPNSHTADWNDIAADALGAMSGEGVIWLVHHDF